MINNPAWNMYVFRDGRRTVSGSRADLASDGRSAAGAHASADECEDCLLAALIAAGELECALLDAAAPTTRGWTFPARHRLEDHRSAGPGLSHRAERFTFLDLSAYAATPRGCPLRGRRAGGLRLLRAAPAQGRHAAGHAARGVLLRAGHSMRFYPGRRSAAACWESAASA